MDTRIKNYLGMTIIFVLVVIAIASAVYVNSYTNSIGPGSLRSFSVSGEGEVTVVPDVAQFSFGVITEGGTNIGTLRDNNTQKANAIIEFVKEQGVADEDIETSSYSVSPRYQHFNCGPMSGPCEPSQIVGYTITQRISVDVHDFETIGTLLSGVVDAGANNVNGPNFTIDDPEQARAEARAEAIEKAQKKAQETAEAAGFRVGKLLSINEGGYTPYGLGSAENSIQFDGAASAPRIEPGTQDVQVTVNLQYEIKD